MQVSNYIYLIAVLERLIAVVTAALRTVILSLLAEMVRESIIISNFNILPSAYRLSVSSLPNIVPHRFSVK